MKRPIQMILFAVVLAGIAWLINTNMKKYPLVKRLPSASVETTKDQVADVETQLATESNAPSVEDQLKAIGFSGSNSFKLSVSDGRTNAVK